LVQNREQIQRASHSEEVQPPSTTMTHTAVRRLRLSVRDKSSTTAIRLVTPHRARSKKPVVDDRYP
jgi:hypothetical protein